MKLKAEEAITIAEPRSSPYVKKPAVKIIIDSKGKAEFLNKNGEVVDGTSGNLMETESSKEPLKESHNRRRYRKGENDRRGGKQWRHRR